VAGWALRNRTVDFVSPEEKRLKTVTNEDATYPKITILLCCSIFRKSVRSSYYPWTRSWKSNFCLGQTKDMSWPIRDMSWLGPLSPQSGTLLAYLLCSCCFSGEQIKAQIYKLI